MIPTDQQVKAAYKAAGKDKKEYINSDELFNTFYAIRTKYNLHVDVAGNLATLIDAVILELVPFSDFPAKLKEILVGASDVEYQAILKSVNDDVFTYFRNKVKTEAEAAKKKADEEAREDAALERELREKDAQLAREQEESTTPVLTAPPSSTTPAPAVADAPAQATPAPAPSVLQQKTSAPTSSAPKETSAPEAPKPAARYHGTDPYREMPE